jgi:hypothetical protein
MCHHFVPRGCCRRRSRLGKSAIAAPTLGSITLVRVKWSTLARVHPEIHRISRSHLAIMHALKLSSLLTCPRDPSSRCRSRSHLTRRAQLKGLLSRAPQGDAAALVTLGIRRRVRALGIRCRSHSHLVAVRASGGHRRVLASGICRRERVPPDLPSRACPTDPPSRACS